MKEQTAYLWKEWTLYNREMFVLLNTTRFSVKR